jgi:hypothetical protein
LKNTTTHATEAHFLHERQGLEAVVRPPVNQPSALTWIPGREELLVGSRTGELLLVDPVMGTRQVAEDVGEAAVLSIHSDRKRYLVLARGGTWQVGTLAGEVLAKGKHDFLSGFDGFFFGDRAVLVGDGPQGRVILVVEDGDVRSRIRVLKRVIALVNSDGRLALARPTVRGLQVVALGKGATFPKVEATNHVLRAIGDNVLGVTGTGLCVWPLKGGEARSVRMPELSVGALANNGARVGMGTMSGMVAMTTIELGPIRTRPVLVKAYNSPVTSMAFSGRGRWLATGAEYLQLWTWEED